jgi:hypothetical protein
MFASRCHSQARFNVHFAHRCAAQKYALAPFSTGERKKQPDNIKSIQIVCKFRTTGACTCGASSGTEWVKHRSKQQQQRERLRVVKHKSEREWNINFHFPHVVLWSTFFLLPPLCCFCRNGIATHPSAAQINDTNALRVVVLMIVEKSPLILVVLCLSFEVLVLAFAFDYFAGCSYGTRLKWAGLKLEKSFCGQKTQRICKNSRTFALKATGEN